MDYLLNYRDRLVKITGTDKVLNLIINGLPSKQKIIILKRKKTAGLVLNLIINGLPSKRKTRSS